MQAPLSHLISSETLLGKGSFFHIEQTKRVIDDMDYYIVSDLRAFKSGIFEVPADITFSFLSHVGIGPR